MFPGAFSGNPHPDHLVRSPEEEEEGGTGVGKKPVGE